MLATYLHSLGPFVFRIGEFGPRWYGLSYVLSALVGFWLYRRLAERGYSEVKPDKIADFITWCGIFGVLLGGRIGWILFYGIKEPHENPWWMLEVWKGGMSSHGGILALVLVTYAVKRVTESLPSTRFSQKADTSPAPGKRPAMPTIAMLSGFESFRIISK